MSPIHRGSPTHLYILSAHGLYLGQSLKKDAIVFGISSTTLCMILLHVKFVGFPLRFCAWLRHSYSRSRVMIRLRSM